MRFFLSSLPDPSKDYSILGYFDNFIFVKEMDSCLIYRKRIFETTGWKRMKMFALINLNYSCLICTLLSKNHQICMLVKDRADHLKLWIYSLTSGTHQIFQCFSPTSKQCAFERGSYELFFNSKSQLRCFPSTLKLEGGRTDFPFYLFNLNPSTSSFSIATDFGLVDFRACETISNIQWCTPSRIIYSYTKDDAQMIQMVDLAILQNAASAHREPNVIHDSSTTNAITIYRRHFVNNLHKYIRFDETGKLIFYVYDFDTGIVKGNLELDDKYETFK